MAVAIQPAIQPGPVGSPIPRLSAGPHTPQLHPGKDDVTVLKPTSNVTGLSNIRSRRERPCDACRRRKSRCVINPGASLCVLCDFHKQDCTFLQDPQPRKRKVTSTGDPKDANTKKRSIDAAAPTHTVKVPTQPQSKQSQVPTRQPLSVIETKVLGETLGLQSNRHGRHLGLSSPFEPVLIGLSSFDSRNESILSLGTLRKVNDNETFIMLPDDSVQDYADEADALEVIDRIVSPHGPALIDIFFRIVHPSFPIMQKKVFMERMRNGEKNFAPPLLAGMYLLAINWWSYDSRLSKHQKPDIEQLDNIAMKSLNAAMQRPKLSTVQAGLLLLQRPEMDSWGLTTQLVAIGQELGLHLDCSDWQIPTWERSLRKRIAWALYMQDKWSSLIHGRPSHIFSANWAVRQITQNDAAIEDNHGGSPKSSVSEEERADLERGHIIFSQMIALTGIMAEIMDTFYTQVAIRDFNKAGSKSTEMILERAKPVQIKLKDWFTRLPPCVRMDNIERGQLAPTGFLHLAYFATEITLHRRIIQSLNQEDSKPYLFYICRSAAKTRLISAMDFVNRLRPEHLQAFWYFPSKINFTLIGTFGALLWATAPGQEEADFYKTRLREYRWTLSVSSNRAEFLDYAVQMLDASRSMLRNLANKPVFTNSRISQTGVPDKIVSNRRPSSPDQMEDVSMGDETPPLTRTTSLSNVSVSVFSGFSTDALDQFSTNSRDPALSPPTPKSTMA